MKKNLVIPILLLLFLSIVTGSCKKYLDINKNPNAADAPPIAGLLANTTNLTGYNVYYLSNYTSYYVQYLASPGVGSSTDTYQQVDPSTAWGSIYNVLTDLYDMRNLADEKGLSAYAGVADILTAINLSMGTNVWGDMPYSEAFVGVRNLAPKFDDQKALYDTCLNLTRRRNCHYAGSFISGATGRSERFYSWRRQYSVGKNSVCYESKNAKRSF